MARADFNMIRFDQEFTAGSPSATKQFPIEGNAVPIDDAYLLIQVQGVASPHAIQINGTVLEAGGLVPAPGSSQAWRVGMNRIPPGILKLGANTITIVRHGNDDFRVGWVVVNWRE